jgi:hypothetical protein
MTTAWNKYQSELSGFTPEELAILRPEYEEYCAKFNNGVWLDKLPPHAGSPMSFDDWWRNAADEAKDSAKSERI